MAKSGSTTGRSQRKTKAAAKSQRASTAKRARPKLSSRAVLRDVEPGSTVECTHCGERVKFQAKMRHKQIICNVYVGRRWDRVEHFHADCYEKAGSPYGDPDTTPPVRRPKSPKDAAATAAAAKAS
ncbi:MAG: hypothetical protein ACK5O2_17495 [Microthrixaceae bacterium]